MTDHVARTIAFLATNGLDDPELNVALNGDSGYTCHDALAGAFDQLKSEKYASALITADSELAAWGLYAAYPRMRPRDIRRVVKFIAAKKDAVAANWLLEQQTWVSEKDLWWIAKTAGRLSDYGFSE